MQVNGFGGPQMNGFAGAQMNPIMMILQLIMQMMSGMMGQQQGQQGAFSPQQSPGFGGGGGIPGGGGCGCGGAGNAFRQNNNNFLGNPNTSGNFSGPGFTGGTNRSGNGLGTNQTGNVGNLGNGQGADAVRWALSQEGVSESRNPDIVRGYSNGRWQAWCADFVSTALKKTGGSPFGHQSSVQGILNWGRNNAGRFMGAGAARSNPGSLRAGDIAVWKQNGRSHVGLVTGVNKNGTFNTIEGNTSDRVARRTHSFSHRTLTGFVRPRGRF